MKTNKVNLNQILLKRVLVIVFIAVFIFIITITSILTQFFYRENLDKTLQLTINVAQNTKKELDKKVFDISLMISYIKELILNEALDFEHLQIMINKVIENDPAITQIYVILDNDAIKFDQNKLKLTNSDIFAYKWFLDDQMRIKFDTIPISEFQYYFAKSKHSGKIEYFDPQLIKGSEFHYVIPISFPIKIDEYTVGTLLIKFNLDFLENFYMTFTPYNDFVVDPITKKFIYIRGRNFLVGSNYKLQYPEITTKDLQLTVEKSIYINEGDNIIFLSPIILGMNTYWVYGLVVPKKELKVGPNKLLIGGIIFFIIIAIIMLIITSNLAKNISIQANALADNLERIYKGNYNLEQLNLKYSFEEVDKIISKTENIKDRLLFIIKKIDKIIEGDYSYIEYASDKDQLAEAVNKLIDDIKRKETQEKAAIEEKLQNDWIRNGIAELHKATRIEENSYSLLADNVVKTIIKYTDAFLGSFFLYNKEKNVLEAISTYAYEDKKAYKKIIELGEGLVGEVAIEKKLTYIENIPKDYHYIISGLAQMKPESIMIVPIVYENVFYGIIEFAFLKKLKDFEIQYFREVNDVLGISLKTITNNIQTENLLKEYEKQRNELQKIQAKLQKNIEELKKREKAILENEQKLQTYFNAINNTLLTLEYTTDGTIIFVNEKFLKSLGYSKYEVKGKNIFELVATKEAKEDIYRNIERIKRNEKIEGIIKRTDKFGETKYFYATYTPFFNADGTLEKIIFLGFDITDEIVKIQNLEKEVRLLKKQLKLLK